MASNIFRNLFNNDSSRYFKFIGYPFKEKANDALFMSITGLPEFSNKSVEEIRMEFYNKNNIIEKGIQNFFDTPNYEASFGNNINIKNDLINNNNQGLISLKEAIKGFDNSQRIGIFGNNNNSNQIGGQFGNSNSSLSLFATN